MIYDCSVKNIQVTFYVFKNMVINHNIIYSSMENHSSVDTLANKSILLHNNKIEVQCLRQ